MELNEYQYRASTTDQQAGTRSSDAGSPSILIPLMGLASETGELLAEHKKWLRDGDSYKLFPERVKEELGDLLWYLTNVASKHGLALEDIATYNLEKTNRRWNRGNNRDGAKDLFDSDFPAGEQLPRELDVSICEEPSGKTLMVINGKPCGDPLRDNRYQDDGYRFHDVFHLSYASILGWSPTLRGLLRRKRKSNPLVDEVEDGGRAIVIEEGIAAMVFSYAERRNFLEGAEGLSYDLLRTIKDMTSHLEVKTCTEGEWERAIMTGFDLWRPIRSAGQGRLRANLELGTIDLVE